VETVVTLSVRGYITDDENFYRADGSTDNRMAAIQQQLMQSGGPLTVSGLGYGDVELNTGGGVIDVGWGPRVLNVRVKPVGGNRVMQVDMTLQYAVARCGSNGALTGTPGDIKSINYAVSYGIDQAGLTTLTV